MDYLETVKLLERVVKIPVLRILGTLENRVIYLSTELGKTSLFALDGGKNRLTSKAVYLAASPKPNMDFVPFTADISRGKELHSVNGATLKGEEFEIAEPGMRITSLACDGRKIAFSGVTGNAGGVFLAENGKTTKLAEVPPYSFVADIDGDCVAGYGMLKGNPRSMELFSVPLSGGETSIFTPLDGSENIARGLSNGCIYYTSDSEKNGWSSWVYGYDTGTGESSPVEFGSSDLKEYGPVEFSFLEPSTGLAIAGKDGERRLFLDGKNVNTPDGVVSGATIAGKDIFFSHSSLVSPPAIFRAEASGKIRPVTKRGLTRVGTVDYLKLRSDVEVPAWLVRPKGDISGVGVVYVHGGPWWEVTNSWENMIAPLVLCGHTVIAPNFRGSTGYGSRFKRMDINDAGGGDLRDVNAARNHIMENRLADHVGIMGYSYGGFMTFLATSKEADQWEFGIAGAGIVDWITMRGMSDSFFKTLIDMLFGGDAELMKDRSALTHIGKVKAPLCIIHSQNDTRTPLLPVLEYARKLHELGKGFEMHIIPDLGHAVTSVSDAMNIMFPALAFLEKRYGEKEGVQRKDGAA